MTREGSHIRMWRKDRDGTSEDTTGWGRIAGRTSGSLSSASLRLARCVPRARTGVSPSVVSSEYAHMANFEERWAASVFCAYRITKHLPGLKPSNTTTTTLARDSRPTDMRGSELMRKGSTYIALCGLLVACTIVVPASAGAATSRARATSSKAEQMTSAKLGSIHMKLLGTTNSAADFLTDGVRWATYEPTEGVTRFMDTVTGHTINRPDPEGCTGGLLAIGGGEVMYECDDPECPGQERSCKFKIPNASYSERLVSRRYVVENIVSGDQHVVPGTNRVVVGAERTFELDTVGSQWAGGIESNDGYALSGDRVFVNWHTGQLVYEGSEPSFDAGNITEEPASNEEEIENLNSVTLLQPLCEPLKRLTRAMGIGGPKYGQFEYEPPFAVLGQAGPVPAETPLQLRRCGSSTRVTLLGGKFGSEEQLGGYVLSWEGVYGGGFDSYSVNYVAQLNPHSRTWFGRIYRLVTLPKYSNKDYTRVWHTGTLIFETVSNIIKGTSTGATIYGEGSRIYFARLPWVTRAH